MTVDWIAPAFTLAGVWLTLWFKDREIRFVRDERLTARRDDDAERLAAIFAEFIAALNARQNMQVNGNASPDSVVHRLGLAQARVNIVARDRATREQASKVAALTERWCRAYRESLPRRVADGLVMISSADKPHQDAAKQQAETLLEELGQAEEELLRLMRAAITRARSK